MHTMLTGTGYEDPGTIKGSETALLVTDMLEVTGTQTNPLQFLSKLLVLDKNDYARHTKVGSP